MSTLLEEAPTSTPLAVTSAHEVRTRYGRAVRAPVRYEPVEQVEDDYAADDYDESESDVSSVIEYDESELEDEDDDSELGEFIVADKSEDDENDNGSGTDSDASAGVRPSVARTGTGARKIPAKAPVRGKKHV
jgi:hypothetical protein